MKALFALMLTVYAFNALALDPPLVKVPKKVQNFHKAIVASGQCDAQDGEYFLPSEYNVDSTTKLYLITCYRGAYNVTSRGYLYYNDGDASSTVVYPVSILTLLNNDDGTASLMASQDLVNVDFDETNKTLYTRAKGRGVGDCGQATESFITTYDSVKTTKIFDKNKCDGQGDEWPLAWEQK